MLEPDYCKARLLEIRVGRRFWQSNASVEDARTFYVRVVEPLRRLQRRGVVEKLRELSASNDKIPAAVEIIGQVDDRMLYGFASQNRAAGGGDRTHTILRSLDFESSASASSATPAAKGSSYKVETGAQARVDDLVA